MEGRGNLKSFRMSQSIVMQILCAMAFPESIAFAFTISPEIASSL